MQGLMALYVAESCRAMRIIAQSSQSHRKSARCCTVAARLRHLDMVREADLPAAVRGRTIFALRFNLGENDANGSG
jgi:hypothetical protein